MSSRAPRSPAVLGAVIFVVIAVGVFVIVAAKKLSTRRDAAAFQTETCTLVTDPPGATIVVIRRAPTMDGMANDTVPPSTFETTVGTTPITKTRADWLIEGAIMSPRFEARLAGYTTIPIAGCRSEPYKLKLAAGVVERPAAIE